MGKKQKRSSQPKAGRPPRGAKSQHPGSYPGEIRLKAVKLYLEEGHRASLIGEELGISSESVKEWVRRYRAEGEAGLLPRYRNRGRPQVPVQVKDKAVAVTDPLRETAVREGRSQAGQTAGPDRSESPDSKPGSWDPADCRDRGIVSLGFGSDIPAGFPGYGP